MGELSPAPAPGWYPDPEFRAGQRYWDGQQWTAHVDGSAVAASGQLEGARAISLAKVLLIPYGLFFGGFGVIFTVLGEWKPLLGVIMLAVMVGAPIALVLLVTRKAKQARREHVARREYEAGLVARFDAAGAELGDVEPGSDPFGFERPLPDAEQMRRQAWQPDEVPAVRPSNPAPWHVVTQYPTRQFRSPASSRAGEDRI